MKLITWNCNMAFRKKAEIILTLEPDIIIVPECEHPDKLIFNAGTKLPDDIIWFGDNLNKGLGVFSYNNYKFKLLKKHNTSFKNILPIQVTKGNIKFILFAIWANNPADKDGTYVTQVWKAINYYEKLIKRKNTILIGDFNSNAIWDRPRRTGNHTDVVNLLATKKIYSTYHTFHNQLHGKEIHPTQFMYRHQDKPYHLDYCFASSDLIKKMTQANIGKYEDWRSYSDHKPLIVEFNLDASDA